MIENDEMCNVYMVNELNLLMVLNIIYFYYYSALFMVSNFRDREN